MQVVRTISASFMDKDARIMRVAKDEAKKSHCARSHFGCVIVGFDDEGNEQMVMAYNGPPIPGVGLCGGNHCLRSEMKIGQGLEISCVHAEAPARWKCLRAGLRPPFTVYLYGDMGISLPCCTCFKEFIMLDMTKFWLAGHRDMFYKCDPEVPKEWLSQIEYGIIPYHYLGDEDDVRDL